MATQAERRAATRAAILAAGTALFTADGFAATTMDRIAAAAGVAKGAVYHHFATKEALFEAVFEAVSEGLAQRLHDAARGAPDVLAAMSLASRLYFRICAEEPAGRVILHDGPAVLGWERWRELDARHFGATIPGVLARAMDQGLIARQPVEPLARLLLGALTEAAVACATAPGAADLYLQAFETLLHGLRRAPHPP